MKVKDDLTERQRMETYYHVLGQKIDWGWDDEIGEYASQAAKDAWSAWQESQRPYRSLVNEEDTLP